MPDVEAKEKLIDLVDYVRHMAELGSKAVFSLKEYKQLVYHEEALKNRVGIHHDLTDEDGAVWLKIDRLLRIDPPPVPEALSAWLSVSRDPTKVPEISQLRTETITAADAEAFINNDILDAEDVQPAMKPKEGQDLRDVIFRLNRNPEIEQAVHQYISGPWIEWSESEKPRRETIAIYDAFFSVEQLIQAEGSDQPLEVVWGIGVARWKTQSRNFDHPLVEQLVELHIDADHGAITIRPRSVEPQIALKPYFSLENTGVDIVLQFTKVFFNTLPEDSEFSPFQASTYEPILRQAVAHLDTGGVYYPDHVSDSTDRSLPNTTESLTITDTWTIYARPRSDNFFIADLERLKTAIEEVEELPGPAERLVKEPSDEGGYRSTIIDIGSGSLGGYHSGVGGSTGGGNLSSSDAHIDGSRTEDFFFPKPFNDEQVSIIQRLSSTDGVVVQGPPGTGKTHTIANIICHYLATGRQVLVTSKGEAALSVLRDHIPEGIRDLVISLLTNERQGLKQLEKAIGLLANTATQLNPRELERDILARQQHILNLQKKIADIDKELHQWAEKHLKRVGSSPDKEGFLPMELAVKVVAERDEHSWFPDRISYSSKPAFSDENIGSVREARKVLGEDLVYLNATLPRPGDLPDTATIGAIHQDLVNERELAIRANESNMPVLSLSATHAIERARHLRDLIVQVLSIHEALGNYPWLRQFYRVWLHNGIFAEEIRLFNDILEPLHSIAIRRGDIVSSAIAMLEEALYDNDVLNAIERVASGSRPFGVLPFGKSIARDKFNRIRVAGKPAETADEWILIIEYIQWRKDIQQLVAKWAPLSVEFGLPKVNDEGDATGRWLSELDKSIESIIAIVEKNAPTLHTEIPVLFPYGMEADVILESANGANYALYAVKQNLSQQQYASSRDKITEVIERLRNSPSDVAGRIRVFVTQHVGNPSIDLRQINESWQALHQELKRLIELKPYFDTVERVAEKIESSGAIKWADALRSEPMTTAEDIWTPETWGKSWEWARLNAYLREIDGRNRIRDISEKLVRYDKDLKKTFAEVVKLRTYLGLKMSITDRVASALSMFTNAIRNIGKGTGVRARRFRRNAREAMEKSYSAVPCWIMPSWRVSESLPSELGSFDLVIVDEASQSDITALPALMRGTKVLIVGDDKQVTPTSSFIEERKILQLQHNYLKGQPFAAAVLPGSSLYSLAQAMFPTNRILLREHFRCVEPIIRFSFQFYTEPLIPLRVPKASERLDPPLIDVYVPNGHKRGQINEPEAEAIVDEIERLVNDLDYAHRSIGVVSLIGTKQAHYIQSMLLERIGEDAFLRHRIACGDSATFQGKERDLMFVSMVDCPKSKSAKTSLIFQQRFNVALSRARDRQYLFRSVTEEMLKPEDLKAKVIRHYKSPMDERTLDIQDLLEICDSDFERDVFKRLNAIGYRVTPQVRVGAYSIDLVIDGTEDKRLAVELDGDRYHTPDRWADDLARQRVLERVGWRFWRCWGSSFALDPDACMDDLVSTLNDMGIEPLGSSLIPAIYTEHRILKSPQVIESEIETIVPELGELHGKLETPPSAEVVLADNLNSAPISNSSDEIVIQAGDRVLIAYNDEPARQYMLTLSGQQHDPDNLIINVDKPLAKALLGYVEEDEVEIPAGGRIRTATIMKVERPANMMLQ